MNYSLENSYHLCLEITRKHYENFPVASLLIPRSKRKYIATIYAFARIADDIADKSYLSNQERIVKLNEYKNLFLFKKLKNEYFHFLALFDTIKQNKINEKHFCDLIDAFIMDNQKSQYHNWKELFEYCERSANPIGRIILELFEIRNERAFHLSDKICTALQLTNFWQDFRNDILSRRFYIPQEVLLKYNLSNNLLLSHAEKRLWNKNLTDMMKEIVDFTFSLFTEGKELLNFLSRRLFYEIKLTILGGEEILKKIIRNNYNVFNTRPILRKSDWVKILLKGLINV